MLKKSILLLLATLAINMASATVFTWSRYDLSFEVPDGGFVTRNTGTFFEIQWDEMVMTVKLYSKDKTTDKEIRQILEQKALGYSMYELKQGNIKVKGFKGLLIDGTMPDGTRAVIADLISKKQDLIVEITVNYLLGNREMVDDMIKSFAENKEQKPNREKKKQKIQPREKAKQQDKQQPKTTPKKEGRLYDA